MGLFGGLGDALDPGGLFGGDHGDVIGNMLDPGGAILENIGWAPEWMSDTRSDVNGYIDSLADFEMSQLSDWGQKFKKDPTQLLIGAGDPFGAKLWGNITGKEYDPYVNQYGGPTGSSYQSAEEKGIDTSNSRGSHAIAQLIASYYGSQGMAAGFGEAGTAAGIGSSAGQAAGGAAVGAGNAWANDGEIVQSALMGALPGLSQMFGGAMNGVNAGAVGDQVYAAETGVQEASAFQKAMEASKNLGKTVGITNPALQQGFNSAVSGLAQGAIGAGLRGDSMKEGAMYGGAQGLLGNMFSQGLSALAGPTIGGSTGNAGYGDYKGYYDAQSGGGGAAQAYRPSQFNSGNIGNALASGLIGLYGANQAKKDIEGQIGNLQGLFGQNSAYSQQLQQELARKDAASGRRSQYGPRNVELQARLAQMASQQAPQLNNLYQQKAQANVSQYKDVYNMLRQSGLLEKLGTMGQNYFNSMGQ